MEKVVIVSTLFFFMAVSNSFGQNDSAKISFVKTCDTISEKVFNKEIKLWNKKMKAKNEFSALEFIHVAKLYLTLSESSKDFKKRRRYLEFSKIYRLQYMGKYCEIMDCSFRRGVVLYSNKYEIYLSKPQNQEKLPCYNYFFIK